MTVDEWILQTELILRILASGVLGSAIGYERKNRNKEAGVRTHAIVALASALMMVISKYGFADMPSHDASRIAAQIVSGIGFLGAGIIFVRNHMVNGLTTAAGIWATAGIGMAVGAGMYYIGVASTVLVVIVQVLMHRGPFLLREPYHETISLVMVRGEQGMKEIKEMLVQEKVEILSLTVARLSEEQNSLDMDVVFPSGYKRADLISLFSASEAVHTLRG